MIRPDCSLLADAVAPKAASYRDIIHEICTRRYTTDQVVKDVLIENIRCLPLEEQEAYRRRYQRSHSRVGQR